MFGGGGGDSEQSIQGNQASSMLRMPLHILHSLSLSSQTDGSSPVDQQRTWLQCSKQHLWHAILSDCGVNRQRGDYMKHFVTFVTSKQWLLDGTPCFFKSCLHNPGSRSTYNFHNNRQWHVFMWCARIRSILDTTDCVWQAVGFVVDWNSSCLKEETLFTDAGF